MVHPGRPQRSSSLALFASLRRRGQRHTCAATAPTTGFDPSQLYDPIQNPGGRILRKGDTGVAFLKAASAASYEFLMEEEDLALLENMEVQDALGTRRHGSPAVHPCQ